MKQYIRLSFGIFVIFMLSGCFPENFQEQTQQMGQKFGDQHFKTVIALVELHNVRHGEYPGSLDELQYVGEWDRMGFTSVKYKKVGNGYELDLVGGWMGKAADISYPEGFWKGLGLVKSNLKKVNP